MACGRRVGAVLAAAQDGGWQHAEASTASSPDFSCISSNLKATGVKRQSLQLHVPKRSRSFRRLEKQALGGVGVCDGGSIGAMNGMQQCLM